MATEEVEEQEVPLSKVFISYSWTTDEYADWVMELATRLVKTSRIDVVLDRWELNLGHDKYKFMERMVADPTIQKVLVVCDERYAERANGRLGGVGTETTIISQEVYNQVKQEKFIPIVAERGPDDEPFLPIFLKSRMYVDLSDPRRYEAGYEDLVRHITGQPLHTKPALGKAPSFVSRGNSTTSPTTFAKRAFEDALVKNKPTSTGLATHYLDELVSALRSLCSSREDLPPGQDVPTLMLERMESWIPLRDEFVEVLGLIARFNTDDRLFDLLPRFFEGCLGVTPSSYDQQNQHVSYIVQEMFLYAVAVFLQTERFEAVATLLDAQYKDANSRGYLQQFGVFASRETQYLELALQNTWEARYESPLCEITRRRATNQTVTFSMLREADLILYLRHLLSEGGPSDQLWLSWWPLTITFNFRQDAGLKSTLMERARSRRYFSRFKVVLGVDSKAELLQRWDKAFPPDTRAMGSDRNTIIQRALNPDQLDTL